MTSEIFLLPPGLSKGEKNHFLKLREHLEHSVAPQNFIEEIYVNELAHLIWQLKDNRQAIESLKKNAREEGILLLLTGRYNDLAELLKGARRQEPEALERIEKLLETFGFNENDVEAHARLAIVDEVERLERDNNFKRDQFDRLVQSLEKRRFLITERLRQLSENYSGDEHSLLGSNQIGGAIINEKNL